MTKFRKILLVDDDETSNFLNEFLIKGMGIVDEVIIATNGQEAIDIIGHVKNSENPEVIFLDLNMPVMDGFEFLENFEKVKTQENIQIPIYILTSSNYFKDFERVKKFAVAGYIIKPLTEDKIFDTLKISE